jgi:hypothetical protein
LRSQPEPTLVDLFRAKPSARVPGTRPK